MCNVRSIIYYTIDSQPTGRIARGVVKMSLRVQIKFCHINLHDEQRRKISLYEYSWESLFYFLLYILLVIIIIYAFGLI